MPDEDEHQYLLVAIDRARASRMVCLAICAEKTADQRVAGRNPFRLSQRTGRGDQTL